MWSPVLSWSLSCFLKMLFTQHLFYSGLVPSSKPFCWSLCLSKTAERNVLNCFVPESIPLDAEIPIRRQSVISLHSPPKLGWSLVQPVMWGSREPLAVLSLGPRRIHSLCHAGQLRLACWKGSDMWLCCPYLPSSEPAHHYGSEATLDKGARPS